MTVAGTILHNPSKILSILVQNAEIPRSARNDMELLGQHDTSIRVEVRMVAMEHEPIPMNRIAYLDIIGGISGDMLISAMIDVGLPKQQLESELRKIVPERFELITTETERGSIRATHTEVRIDSANLPKLGWIDFYRCIDQSTLPDSDLTQIRAIFDCLRNAEGKAHDASNSETHLHELGTLDTLIDFASAVIGLRMLGIATLYASPIPASMGFSASSHGKNASIAPATMEIIKSNAIPVRIAGPNQPRGESVTPSGAAILATLATFQPANITVQSVGYGAGTRNSDTPPNVLGIWMGNSTAPSSTFRDVAESVGLTHQNDVILIETNIDDMTGEELGYAVGELFNEGALDAWTTSIQMKKSRPGSVLSAIANQRDLATVTKSIFANTSTLGIRVRQLDRMIADREVVSVETDYGPIRVKLRIINHEVTTISPEYGDCADVAAKWGMPIRAIMDAARDAFRQAQ